MRFILGFAPAYRSFDVENDLHGNFGLSLTLALEVDPNRIIWVGKNGCYTGLIAPLEMYPYNDPGAFINDNCLRGLRTGWWMVRLPCDCVWLELDNGGTRKYLIPRDYYICDQLLLKRPQSRVPNDWYLRGQDGRQLRPLHLSHDYSLFDVLTPWDLFDSLTPQETLAEDSIEAEFWSRTPRPALG